MSEIHTFATAPVAAGTPVPPVPARQRSRWELVVPLAAIGALLLSCAVVSAKKYYWNDEFFSYYMTSEVSFSRMLTAFNDKLNNTPIFYFVLGWLWDKAFSSSEISLRLFSCLGMCAALLIIWQTIRRYYDFWSTSLAVVLITCTSDLIYVQNAEARMYGLYLLLCAIILHLYAEYYRKRTISTTSLVLNMLVHAALVHTHLFGLFYSGAVFVAFVLTDRLFKVFRPKIYLSLVLGWASLIFYIPAFLIQADAGKPRTWIPAPDLRDLIDIYNVTEQNFFSRTLIIALLLLLGYFYLRSSRKANYFARYKVSQQETPLLILAVGFLLVPVFVWLISITVKPVFWPRYMIPTAIGWIILLAFFISRNMPLAGELAAGRQPNKRLSTAINGVLASLLIGFCIWQPLMKAYKYPSRSVPGLRDLDVGVEDKYGALPRVLIRSDEFQQRLHYYSDGRKYFYILDWKSAVDKHSGTFPPQEYKHMEAWKRNFPEIYRDNIIRYDEFLRRYDKFLVIDRPKYWTKCPVVHRGIHDPVNLWEYCLDCPQLVNVRFLNNQAYKVTTIRNQSDKYFAILLVEKIAPPKPAATPVAQAAGLRSAP